MQPSDPGCAFCGIVRGAIPASVIWQSPEVVAFLDARPVFKGHVLVVPKAHHATVVDLPADLREPFMAGIQHVTAGVVTALGAQGTFVAMNNVVSQSVPHLHAHVVPRTKGDGLKGFFWPRTKYPTEASLTETGATIRTALRP